MPAGAIGRSPRGGSPELSGDPRYPEGQAREKPSEATGFHQAQQGQTNLSEHEEIELPVEARRVQPPVEQDEVRRTFEV